MRTAIETVPPAGEQCERRRLQVLLIAHEFSPAEGSECFIGWNFAVQMSRHHETTVVCADGPQWNPGRFQSDFDQYLASHGPVPGLNVVFVPQPRLGRALIRVNKRLSGMPDAVGIRILYVLALRAWQRRVAQMVNSQFMHKTDVVHHLTPIAYWACTPLWKFPKPSFWGPMSGLGGTPLRFARWLGWRMVVTELARSSFNALQVHLSRRLRKALNTASVVWTVAECDAEIVRSISGRRPRSMVEVSTPPGLPSRIRSYDGSKPLSLCWSGAHFNRKALPILLYALASSSQLERIRLVVLSGGQLTSRWKELAMSLGLGEQIRWTGYLPRAQAMEEMSKADVFVHTSVREATSSVIIESFAMGLPVISHDAFGMSVALDDRCGIKVPFIGPKESVAGFRSAIERFIFEPGLVQKLSEGALERSAELTWEAKVEEISEAYRECVEAAQAARSGPGRLLQRTDAGGR